MSLFSGNFYLVVYHKTASWHTYDVIHDAVEASLESKSNWANGQEITYIQKIWHFLLFLLVLYVNLENEK